MREHLLQADGFEYDGIREVLETLHKEKKKILMLYYYEELRVSEIAKIFSLTEGRISQILSQSILSLKAKFKSIN